MAVATHPWYFETDSARDAMEARRALERYLADHCEEADMFPAALVFGELISNVIKHAPGGGVRVWLEPDGDRYALCIHDAGKGFGDPRFELPADPRAESGRGLFLVKNMACRLEYARNGGFMVRAVLPVKRRMAG
jgi:anti-sigma regulatory factor (Ser/Thr protein kinase)